MRKQQPPQQLQPAPDNGAQVHIPVLLDEVLEYLTPKPGESYLDLTAGYGGHARAILAETNAWNKATLVDRDSMALASLDDLKTAGVELVHASYADFAEEAVRTGKRYDMILVDLGVSSPQLDKAERGFSLKRNGPLDMRMDQKSSDKNADFLVNHMNEQDLVRIITTYGEEPLSSAKRIAKAIVASRPLSTTHELAEVILTTHRGSYKKTHPATRTFQAFRIVVNDELGQLERLLRVLPRLLTSGGRVAIISFHSLEDRLVKRFFVEQANAGYESEFDLLNGRATRGKTDDVFNPRARSAMLRAAVKK